jgi:tight adherence protein B
VDPLALLAAGTAAAAVTLVIIGVFGAGRSRATDRLTSYPTAVAQPVSGQRTGDGSTGTVLVGGSVVLSGAQQVFQRSAWSERTARDLGRADLVLTPAEYLAFRVAAVVAALGICWVLGATVLPALRGVFALAGAALIGYAVPLYYVRRRQNKRLRAFNDGLSDTITLVANALRAGSSFLQSLELVTRETQPPISTEFSRVVREVSLGLPLETALNNLNARVHSDDLELMSTAISIQYQVGGNLAEILDTIAETIRERVRIRGEIRTLTAQQRLSGYVVGFLPVGLLLILMVIAPKFINPMFQQPPGLFGLPLGVFLLAIGGTMMAIGFVFIRRIVNIEV